ncbi:hypothetical protein [Nonomuraea sp. NPDC049129]|uniref:hypothetical protein n=1 Tax=unclassified Nonomuraea TaxID=2593643 RepID=UPI0033CBCBC7
MRQRRRGRLALALFGVIILAAGCGSPRTFQVAPAVLDNVRGIGSVVEETSSQAAVDGGIEITRTLVVDVEAADAKDALNAAVERLRKREWEILAENRPVKILMKSNKWDKAHLSIATLDPEKSETAPDPKIAEKILTKKKPLIVIDVYEYN